MSKFFFLNSRIQNKCPLARRSVNSIKWELALDFVGTMQLNQSNCLLIQ